jgi:hypothetical protein
LCDDTLHEGLHRVQLILGALQDLFNGRGQLRAILSRETAHAWLARTANAARSASENT